MKIRTEWLKNNWVIVLAISWFTAGFILLFIYLALYKAVNWEVLTGFATWILAGGVGVAIWQIIVTRENTTSQLEAARKSTNAQLAVELFEKFRSDEMLKIIREIIYSNDRETLKGFSTGEIKIEKIGHVLDWLDILGILVRKEIVDRDLGIMGFAGATAVRCWYKLAPFMREMQRIRGFYNENYEDFVHSCIEIFKEEKIEVYLKDIKGNLVEIIQKLPEDQRPRSLEEIKRKR